MIPADIRLVLSVHPQKELLTNVLTQSTEDTETSRVSLDMLDSQSVVSTQPPMSASYPSSSQSTISASQQPSSQPAVRRGRGRPKGSKNKPKTTVTAETETKVSSEKKTFLDVSTPEVETAKLSSQPQSQVLPTKVVRQKTVIKVASPKRAYETTQATTNTEEPCLKTSRLVQSEMHSIPFTSTPKKDSEGINPNAPTADDSEVGEMSETPKLKKGPSSADTIILSPSKYDEFPEDVIFFTQKDPKNTTDDHESRPDGKSAEEENASLDTILKKSCFKDLVSLSQVTTPEEENLLQLTDERDVN